MGLLDIVEKIVKLVADALGVCEEEIRTAREAEEKLEQVVKQLEDWLNKVRSGELGGKKTGD